MDVTLPEIDWLKLSEDGRYLIASRCAWMYRGQPRSDDEREAVLQKRDGDIVVACMDNMGANDIKDLRIMLDSLSH